MTEGVARKYMSKWSGEDDNSAPVDMVQTGLSNNYASSVKWRKDPILLCPNRFFNERLYNGEWTSSAE